MKIVPLLVLMLLVVAPVRPQGGTDTRAKLDQALTAAQKAQAAGNLEQAEELLKAVGTAVHDDFRAVLLRATVNFEMGEYGKAATYAARASELNASDLGARVLGGRALYQQAEALKSSPLNSGSRVNGFYEAALTEFDKASKLKPDSPELMGWKASCLLALDRIPEAVQLWEDVKKKKPDDPEAFLRIAQMQVTANNTDAALKAASDGLATKGASNLRGDLAQVIFGILGTAKKYPEMFAIFKAWSTNQPNDAQAYLWMGYTKFMEGNVDEAISLYSKGFEVSGKKHGGLALELGNALAQKGDAMKAAEAYGAALKAQPEWPNYETSPIWRLNLVSRTFVEKGDYAKGIEILEKYALPAALTDRYTMNNLGLYYRDWGARGKKSDGKAKFEKSLDYYTKASKLVVEDPNATPTDKAQVLNDTGVIHHYHLEGVEKAIEYYRQALTNDPNYKDALENLGLCFNILGKYEEAMPLFQKVLEQEGGRRVSREGLNQAKKAVEKDQKPASR